MNKEKNVLILCIFYTLHCYGLAATSILREVFFHQLLHVHQHRYFCSQATAPDSTLVLKPHQTEIQHIHTLNPTEYTIHYPTTMITLKPPTQHNTGNLLFLSPVSLGKMVIAFFRFFEKVEATNHSNARCHIPLL